MPLATVGHLAPVGDIEIAYEAFGDPDDPPLVLLAGLGSPMLLWDTEFCEGLVDRMFHVIRCDHRDVGLSSSLDALGPYPIDAALQARAEGTELPPAPYSLSDLADDVAGLLDHLGIAAAHVVGVSMGGMVAQVLAIEHPGRVLSLTSLSSSTGETGVGGATPEALAAMFESPAHSRHDVIEQNVRARKVWATESEWDEVVVRDYFTRAFDHGHRPEGASRQVGALLSAPDRTAGLAGLDVATLVMHGDADLLVAFDGGERTAELIDGAELVVLEDMGHDIPPIYWAQIIENVTRLAVRAAQPARNQGG